MRAIVTVKLERNIRHNPMNKVMDECPISKTIKNYHLCTDSTGAHHSYLESGLNLQDIEKKAKLKFKHVTRVEAYDDPEEVK